MNFGGHSHVCWNTFSMRFYSPDNRNLFLSCSADGSLRLYR